MKRSEAVPLVSVIRTTTEETSQLQKDENLASNSLRDTTLVPDVIRVIAFQLAELVDFISMRSTCHSWRESLTNDREMDARTWTIDTSSPLTALRLKSYLGDEASHLRVRLLSNGALQSEFQSRVVIVVKKLTNGLGLWCIYHKCSLRVVDQSGAVILSFDVGTGRKDQCIVANRCGGICFYSSAVPSVQFTCASVCLLEDLRSWVLHYVKQATLIGLVSRHGKYPTKFNGGESVECLWKEIGMIKQSKAKENK